MAKLIRDGIPANMRTNGYEPELRIAEGAELRQMLLTKLIEEATEARDSGGDINELGDVYEVLTSLANIEAIERAAHQKAQKFGRFQLGIVWENDTDPAAEADTARAKYNQQVASNG